MCSWKLMQRSIKLISSEFYGWMGGLLCGDDGKSFSNSPFLPTIRTGTSKEKLLLIAKSKMIWMQSAFIAGDMPKTMPVVGEKTESSLAPLYLPPTTQVPPAKQTQLREFLKLFRLQHSWLFDMKNFLHYRLRCVHFLFTLNVFIVRRSLFTRSIEQKNRPSM